MNKVIILFILNFKALEVSYKCVRQMSMREWQKLESSKFFCIVCAGCVPIQYLLYKVIRDLAFSRESTAATGRPLKRATQASNDRKLWKFLLMDVLFLERKISEAELTRLRYQFYSRFGVDPVGKADPEIGIEARVMDFNLDWKNILTQNSRLIFRGTPSTDFAEL